MNKSSLQSMETIHEMAQPSPKTTVRPRYQPSFDLSAEEALFTVVKHKQSAGSQAMTMNARSASLRVPVSRKASHRIRGWVKRSSSSRATTAAESTTSDPRKARIRHLGGGKADEATVQGTANNTTLLAPGTRRAQRSRASSVDSRMTQWLDFYPPLPSAAGKSDSLLPEEAQKPRSRPGRTAPDADLRPLPLRVPSAEKRPPVPPPSKTLTRKNSQWKPLPTLPGSQAPGSAGDKHLGTDSAICQVKNARQANERDDDRPPPQSETSKAQEDEVGFLPILRYGTPPPTPDSGAEGAARVSKGKGKEREKGPDGGCRVLGAEQQQQQPDGKPESHRAVLRHTRQERTWLHVNYRGEAPFLQAWGLDIANLSDRLEGLSILRDLMQAETDKPGAAGVV
ncbi:hypothetical protein VTK26DRAFT_7395 [Humicola hyalothermophila]